MGESAGKLQQLVNEVADASSEQAKGIEQINTAVSQMDKITQSNAASAEESASASEELSAQAREMDVGANHALHANAECYHEVIEPLVHAVLMAR